MAAPSAWSDHRSKAQSMDHLYQWDQPMEKHRHRWENNIKVEIPKFSTRMSDGREKGEVNLNLTQGATLHMVGAAPTYWRGRWRERSRLVKNEKSCCMSNLSLQLNVTLYKSSQNLHQTGSFQDYTEAFYQLIVQIDLNESKEKMITWYLNGLKPSIQDLLTLHSIWTISGAYNHALLIEKQQTRGSSIIYINYLELLGIELIFGIA